MSISNDSPDMRGWNRSGQVRTTGIEDMDIYACDDVNLDVTLENELEKKFHLVVRLKHI